jgi:hypothetical protein
MLWSVGSLFRILHRQAHLHAEDVREYWHPFLIQHYGCRR